MIPARLEVGPASHGRRAQHAEDTRPPAEARLNGMSLATPPGHLRRAVSPCDNRRCGRATPSGGWPERCGRPTGLRRCPTRRSHPVEGGSANDHDYCSSDPVNCNDTDGTASTWKTLRTVETTVDDHGRFGRVFAAVRIQTASHGRVRVQWEIRTSGAIRSATFQIHAWIQGPDGKVHHDGDFTFFTGQGVAHPSAPYVEGGRYNVWGDAEYDDGIHGLKRTVFWGSVDV
jgi:hypothetical protein